MLNFLSSFQVILRRIHFSRVKKYFNLRQRPFPYPSIPSSTSPCSFISKWGFEKGSTYKQISVHFVCGFYSFLRNVEDSLRSLWLRLSDYLLKTEADNGRPDYREKCVIHIAIYFTTHLKA